MIKTILILCFLYSCTDSYVGAMPDEQRLKVIEGMADTLKKEYSYVPPISVKELLSLPKDSYVLVDVRSDEESKLQDSWRDFQSSI